MNLTIFLDERKCFLGQIELSVGDEVKEMFENTEKVKSICHCNIPPVPTCILNLWIYLTVWTTQWCNLINQ